MPCSGFGVHRFVQKGCYHITTFDWHIGLPEHHAALFISVTDAADDDKNDRSTMSKNGPTDQSANETTSKRLLALAVGSHCSDTDRYLLHLRVKLALRFARADGCVETRVNWRADVRFRRISLRSQTEPWRLHSRIGSVDRKRKSQLWALTVVQLSTVPWETLSRRWTGDVPTSWLSPLHRHHRWLKRPWILFRAVTATKRGTCKTWKTEPSSLWTGVSSQSVYLR